MMKKYTVALCAVALLMGAAQATERKDLSDMSKPSLADKSRSEGPPQGIVVATVRFDGSVNRVYLYSQTKRVYLEAHCHSYDDGGQRTIQVQFQRYGINLGERFNLCTAEAGADDIHDVSFVNLIRPQAATAISVSVPVDDSYAIVYQVK